MNIEREATSRLARASPRRRGGAGAGGERRQRAGGGALDSESIDFPISLAYVEVSYQFPDSGARRESRQP
jgi:hypothetical protein